MGTNKMTMTQERTSPVGRTPLHGNFEAELPPRFFLPPLSSVRPPSTVHAHHTNRFSDGQRTDATRVQTSFSSGASESSNFSYKKQHTDLQRPSPTFERATINGERRVSAQLGSVHSQKTRQVHTRPEMAKRTSANSTYIHERRQVDMIDEVDTDHDLWILFWLSALDPIHSIASCLFTIIVIFGLLLASPIRLIHGQSSLGDQVIRAIAPLYKNHLEMIYAPSIDHAHEWDFSPRMLVLIEIISPIISIGVVLAAWVSAAFWVFTFIMGNPDGTERRDDGRDAVLAVRNWWERFLLKALRSKKSTTTRRSTV